MHECGRALRRIETALRPLGRQKCPVRGLRSAFGIAREVRHEFVRGLPLGAQCDEGAWIRCRKLGKGWLLRLIPNHYLALGRMIFPEGAACTTGSLPAPKPSLSASCYPNERSNARPSSRHSEVCFIAQTRSGIQSSLFDSRKGFLMTPSQSDWQYLAEQASNEMDPDKLVSLVSQLNRVLGEQEERSRALLQGNESTSLPAAV